jgi:hypothetical protein
MRTSDRMTTEELAEWLHERLCNRFRPCGWQNPESSHHLHYARKAESLMNQLEPEIGRANVLPVIKIVVGELF